MAGPYELYLIRHAVAEERSDAWPDDAKRPLTAGGISRFRKSVRGLAELGVNIDVVLTSPLVRARQTAELVAAGLAPKPPLIVVEALAPGGSLQALFADLDKQSRRTRIALVGHEPGIGELAARLAGLRHPLAFKKGAVCRVDLDAISLSAPGSLKWFATPKMLRSIGA
jgi:phosphohistidine phosphatase